MASSSSSSSSSSASSSSSSSSSSSLSSSSTALASLQLESERTTEIDQQPQIDNMDIDKLREQDAKARQLESLLTAHACYEAAHAAVPECIVPNYVYSPGDPIELVPPYPTCISDQHARNAEEQERITCEALGIPYRQRPQLATGSVCTPEQRDALISAWNRDGHSLMLAPSSWPVRACWRTRPCLGFTMIKNPMDEHFQRAAREIVEKQLQDRIIYKQQRDAYLIHVFNTQGLQALEDALEMEKSSWTEQGFKIKVQEYAQQQEQKQQQKQEQEQPQQTATETGTTTTAAATTTTTTTTTQQ